MRTKVVLFDLDGTLLPMNLERFIKKYFDELFIKFRGLGYSKTVFTAGMWSGIQAMFKNDGKRTNEEIFWDKFYSVCGNGVREHLGRFDEFYEKDFDKVREVCGYNPEAAAAVRRIKDMGYRVALATQPVFPAVATMRRISWVGLEPSDFELFTTYENSHFCKPRLEYYGEIVDKLGVLPEECLMVGNDVDEDMITSLMGMKVFLMTDDLINKGGKDISAYPRGSFTELIEYLERL